MARKTPKSSLIPSPWHAGLWVCCLAIIGLLAAIWYSGQTDAVNAMDKGRRLVITLGTGEIQGVKPADARKAALAAPVSHANIEVGSHAPVMPAAEKLAPVNPALMEQATAGNLPIIGPDGTKSWRYYSRPYEQRGSAPMIAIIISGLGQSSAVTESAIRLSPDITLSFSPYTRESEKWIGTARAAGHEVLLDLPLEPIDYPATDPGPYALLTLQKVEENQKAFQKVMASAGAYVGMLAAQNEQFTSNNDAYRLLLQDVANHGLMLVMSREPHKTETREILDASNTPAVISDVWIDEDASPESIQERLATLEQIAKKRGYAVGYAQAYPISVDQIRQWSTVLISRGFVLVPVTFIAKPRFS